MTFPQGYPDPNEIEPRPRRQPSRGAGVWILPLIIGLLLGYFIYRFWVDRGTVSLDPRPVMARGDLAADEQATIELFREASPSVVFITTSRQGFDRYLRRAEQPVGSGSGFLWDNAGHVVTNFHVVQSMVESHNTAQVSLWNHKSYSATLVGAAPAYDLAVLKINAGASALRPIPIGTSADLKVGQKAFAIGNPFGLDQSLSTGVVSALERTITSITGRPIEDVIQTDAAINPGNSGGPLLDSAGRLIGVNTAIISPSGVYAGIGFAVPVDTVNRIVPQLLAHKVVVRPYLGVQIVDSFSQQVTRQLGIQGLTILIVEPDSPAARAGLRATQRSPNGIIPGDIIQEADAKPVRKNDDLYAILERKRAGDELTLKIFRGGNTQEVKVKLDPPRE